MHDYVLRRPESTTRQALTIPMLAVPSALAPVRERVARHCAAWGCPELGEVAALCVSELVTNVIVHVGEGCPVSIRLSPAGRAGARLAVTDPEPGTSPTVLAPGPEAESGRGIALVAALAEKWGVERGRAAKTVWCELGCASDGRGSVRRYATGVESQDNPGSRRVSDQIPDLTIESIASALPAEHRERFEDEVRRTPAPQLPTLLANWRGLALVLSVPGLDGVLTEPVDVDAAPSASDYTERGAA